MLCYGLPAVAVISQALSKDAGRSLPGDISRSKLIRDLSVFVANIENICTPKEATYAVCIQASQIITRTLEDVLDADAGAATRPNAVLDATGNGMGDAQVSSLLQWEVNNPQSELAPELDYNALSGLDTFDLDTWLKNVDWTGIGDEFTF